MKAMVFPSLVSSRLAQNVLESVHTHIHQIVIAVVIVRIVFILLAPLETLTYRTTDDAYYYYKVALNFVSGAGVTFDGINQTNGFHPLWMGVLLPIFALTKGNPEWALRCVCCLLSILAGGSFLFCWYYVRRRMGSIGNILVAVLFLHPVLLNQLLNGLETGLLIFLLFMYIYIEDRYELSNPLRGEWLKKALLGLLLGLIVLCRLDSVFMLIAMLLIAWFFYTTKPFSVSALRELFTWYWLGVAAFIILVAPYFLWNIFTFGHGMPISGELKTSFPHLSIRLSKFLNLNWLPYTIFILAGISWVVISILFFRDRVVSILFNTWRRERYVPILVVLWLACILHFVHAGLFLKWAAYWWHFASYVPVIGISLTWVLLKFIKTVNRSEVAISALLPLMVLISSGSYGFEWYERGTHHAPWFQGAMWVKNNLPPNTVLAMTDCGLFGYFCDRRTINLDGVINGYEFQTALSENKLPEYLKKCGVTHIVDYEVREDRRDHHRIELPARLTGKPGYELLLTPVAEVYASTPYRQRCFTGREKPSIRFIVWDYSKIMVRPILREGLSKK